MRIEHAVALDVLGLIQADDLSGLAVSWLQEGVDSPSLAVLAGGSSRSDPRELHHLLHEASRELGFDVPSPQAAAEIAKRFFAQEVVAGAMPPADGAYRIIYDVYYPHVNDTGGLDSLLGEDFGIARLAGAYYGLDEVEGDASAITFLEKSIRDACQEIVDGTHGV